MVLEERGISLWPGGVCLALVSIQFFTVSIDPEFLDSKSAGGQAVTLGKIEFRKNS